MADDEGAAPLVPRTASMESLVALAHLVYALHAIAVVSGVLGSATIVGSFVASVPSIVAVILNYLKRAEARGIWLESHFRWQIRTFWFALLWVGVAVLMVLSLVGVPLALLIVLVVGLWVFYRVARGWWSLSRRTMMPMPRETL
ncbi:MAG: hypothetical protein HYS20_01055 [Rhodocyclales bacterium]|nr:hypothetical protein [Rhodocyclales bacterium]